MEFFVNLGLLIIQNSPQLVGFVMPLLVEVLNRDVKTSTLRCIVAVLACFIVAVLLHWKQLQYGTPEQVAMYLGLIFTEMQLTYQLYFKGSMLQYLVQSLIGSNRLHEWVDEEPVVVTEDPQTITIPDPLPVSNE